MTWAVCDAVNLRYTFLHQDGASGQRARNEDCFPPAQSHRSRPWYVTVILIPSYAQSLAILSNSATCYQ